MDSGGGATLHKINRGDARCKSFYSGLRRGDKGGGGGGERGGGFQRDGDIEVEKEGRKDGNGGGSGACTEAVLKEKRPSARPTLTNG